MASPSAYAHFLAAARVLLDPDAEDLARAERELRLALATDPHSRVLRRKLHEVRVLLEGRIAERSHEHARFAQP